MSTDVPNWIRSGRLTRRRALGAGIAVASSLLFFGVDIAHADRFGEPSQYVVTVPTATVYTQPSASARAVGVVSLGNHLVGITPVTGSDGNTWLQIPEGYVPMSQAREDYNEWVAQVIVPSVTVYAESDNQSAVMGTAKQGDLLRVVGVSPGLNGDPSIYWATTAGFVDIGTLNAAKTGWGAQWTLPSASEAPEGWWAAVVSEANVRVGPTTQAPIVGGLHPGNMVKVLSQATGENVQGSDIWYRIDGGRYAGAWVHGSLVQRAAPPQPDATPPPGGTGQGLWLVVNKSASSLTVVQNGNPTFTTYTSLGLAGVQTPSGLYATTPKFVADRMTSRTVPTALNEYDLPAVPWTQYYTSAGAAVHGAYWHDDFGAPHSEGCINLTWADSWYVFNLTQPVVPPGQLSAQAVNANATALVIVG
jgi:lipoprotein-anchoring transpeptidase ErfK/SrfK